LRECLYLSFQSFNIQIDEKKSWDTSLRKVFIFLIMFYNYFPHSLSVATKFTKTVAHYGDFHELIDQIVWNSNTISFLILFYKKLVLFVWLTLFIVNCMFSKMSPKLSRILFRTSYFAPLNIELLSIKQFDVNHSRLKQHSKKVYNWLFIICPCVLEQMKSVVNQKCL